MSPPAALVLVVTLRVDPSALAESSVARSSVGAAGFTGEGDDDVFCYGAVSARGHGPCDSGFAGSPAAREWEVLTLVEEHMDAIRFTRRLDDRRVITSSRHQGSDC